MVYTIQMSDFYAADRNFVILMWMLMMMQPSLLLLLPSFFLHFTFFLGYLLLVWVGVFDVMVYRALMYIFEVTVWTPSEE
jgi:hypothetical protein